MKLPASTGGTLYFANIGQQGMVCIISDVRNSKVGRQFRKFGIFGAILLQKRSQSAHTVRLCLRIGIRSQMVNREVNAEFEMNQQR